MISECNGIIRRIKAQEPELDHDFAVFTYSLNIIARIHGISIVQSFLNRVFGMVGNGHPVIQQIVEIQYHITLVHYSYYVTIAIPS